jgi:hypothetical protein
MAKRIIDIRNRPAFLHDFYGARRDSSEFAVVKWLNGRTGSKEPEHFSRSQTEAGYLEEIRSAGVVLAVVIGRDTPAIKNDNNQIARLVARHPQLIGVGSVDPDRLAVAGAVARGRTCRQNAGIESDQCGARLWRAAAPFRRSCAPSALRSAAGVAEAGLSDDVQRPPISPITIQMKSDASREPSLNCRSLFTTAPGLA